MVERRLGQVVTYDTRAESEGTVDRIKRRQQVTEIITELGPMTAKQVAVEMYRRGMTHDTDRNNASPRLTELCRLGIAEQVGKAACEYTGKTVAVFARRK